MIGFVVALTLVPALCFGQQAIPIENLIGPISGGLTVNRMGSPVFVRKVEFEPGSIGGACPPNQFRVWTFPKNVFALETPGLTPVRCFTREVWDRSFVETYNTLEIANIVLLERGLRDQAIAALRQQVVLLEKNITALAEKNDALTRRLELLDKPAQ